MRQKTESPRGASANNDQRTTLDPTGMFRNRGRHVVSRNTVPQDCRPREGSDQSSACGGFNAEQLREHAVSNNDESSSSSPDRRLTNPGKSDAANVQENSEHLGLTQQNKESDDADETDSTVSIMGSIINDDLDGDEGLKKMDVVRWKSAMKIYRSDVKSEMQDVQEDHEFDAVDQADNDDATIDDADMCFNSEPKLAVNSELQQALLNDTINSEAENDEVNISMECHVDTSHLLDESLLSQHEEMNDIPSHTVVQVADFTVDNSDLMSDVISPNKKHGNGQGKDTIQGSNKSPVHQPTRSILGQESPLRAALRRTENNIRRITSPRLPPSSSTRVSNNSVLPLPLQLATKCFSFDDTTIDEDATVPYQPQLDMFGQSSPKKRLPRQQKQYQQSRNPEYYGLSGVASFSYEDVNSLKKAIPLNKTPRSFSGAFRSSSYNRDQENSSNDTRGQLGSFQVIRQSKTWGGAGNDEDTSLRQRTIIFNSDTENDHIHVTDSSDDTHYILEKARMLLSQMVNRVTSFNNEYTSHFKAALCTECTAKTDNSTFRCEKCHDQLKLVVNSIKEVSSLHNNLNAADVKTQESDEARLVVIDAILESYNFTRDLNKLAIAAQDWLRSEQDLFASNQSATSPASQSVDAKDEEIKRLNAEISSCREEIGRLRNISQPSVSVFRSMLSNSSEDSIDACLQPDNSLILSSPHPVVKLSESHEDSFARFERRMDAELKVESLKEIIKLKAALEEANRKIASLESCNKSQVEKDPFPSDVEPIEPVTGSDEGEIFMRIAEDIENSTDEPMLSEFETAASLDKIRLDDPCLEKELDEYRAAIIESVSGKGVADVAQDMSKSCDSEFTEQKMISVRMLDAENFITEWDSVSPLPPPPDHGLHSPIVDTILSKWTDDQKTQSALVTWAESILEGSSPDNVPPLKIAGLDYQLKEGFIMHIFPLLLRRKDIHLQVTSRATRTTSYDIAVSISSSLDGSHQTPVCESNGSIGPSKIIQPSLRDNKHHLMAFRATCNGSTKENDNSQLSKYAQRHGYPDILRSGSNAGSCFTAATTPISNRTPTKYSNSSHAKTSDNNIVETSIEFPVEPQLPIMAGASPSLVDDLSVGSSFDDEEIREGQDRHNGIINSIGGAFGLLSRKKTPISSNRSPHVKSTCNGNNDSPPQMILTPQRQVTKNIDDYDHPYHRLVSAPPGKIGLTFIEHRGHCMVSNVSGSSPLAGWVHPSDILIAIDDTPVSGLRTREIVNILTAKKERRRDLRMISSHDMNELIRPGTA